MIESIFHPRGHKKKLADAHWGLFASVIQTLRTQRYAPNTMQRYVHAAATSDSG